MARVKKQAEAEIPADDTPADGGFVWKGNDALRELLVPIRELQEDPDNANTHPDRSLEDIAASYLRFGQQKPLVCGKGGLVKDGNGQLVAAAGLGWTHVAVLQSDLEGVELQAYSLAANRTAELSEWDFEALAKQLKELQEAGAAVDDVGWNAEELKQLMAGPPVSVAQSGNPGTPDIIRSNPDRADGREYDESIAETVKYHVCPNCEHRWPQ